VRHFPSEAEMGDRRRTKVPRNPPQTPERSTAAVIPRGPCLTARPDGGPKTRKCVRYVGSPDALRCPAGKVFLTPRPRTSNAACRLHRLMTLRSVSGPR
jgi:hypothetical protein